MTNRLAETTSPYLLQHQHNPVHWQPWGPEAFEAARERDVPIFLSVGYSTCYWCHVMERESFEDEATARVMNENFVNIKVDREEHPEVDDVYMAATQIMTGRGGWPMSVFLEPDSLKPFYCGTYYPAEPRMGMPSFKQVLGGISSAWKEKRDQIGEQADRLAAAVTEHLSGRDEAMSVELEQVRSAAGALLQMHDETNGGFGGAPKFPQPVYLELLLDAHRVAGDEQTRSSIERVSRFTLDRMAIGGLFDHVGGGFHRYCVDATWTVPHFEKMLYDNAQLASLYARAATRFNDDSYRRTVRRTLEYVRREMTDPAGGFYSAQDAEVDGREGLNYLWTPEQIKELLGEEDAALALDVYGLSSGTNFQDPHHPEDGPKNVLRLSARPAKVAQERGMSTSELLDRLDAINAELYEAREHREQPGTDDKVLAGWNGLMIAAMADGSPALDDPAFADSGERAAAFILQTMRSEDGRLKRVYRRGEVGRSAVLEDYAYLIHGLLALHEVGRGDGRWLDAAKDLAHVCEEDFADPEGGYFDVAEDRSELFVRGRSTYDGAVPSATSVMLHDLVTLAQIEPDGPWLDRAIGTAKSVSAAMAQQPVTTANSTRAVLRLVRMGERVAQRLEFGGGAPAGEALVAMPAPVSVYADRERVAVSDESPAELNLVIQIEEGWHILSADPAPEGADLPPGLVPLRVGLVSGSGVAVYADYPEGASYGAGFLPESAPEIRVHQGTVELRVAVEKAEGVGAGEGRPILGVTFQACSETDCLEPRTVELDVAVDIE